jgi:two-component system OmpR family response regulator
MFETICTMDMPANAASVAAQPGSSVDILLCDGAPADPLRQCIERAGAIARLHRVDPASRQALQVVGGDLLILCATRPSVPVQLLLAELRGQSHAGLALIAPDLNAEDRILARIHGADHVLDAAIDPRELVALVRNELRRSLAARALPRADERDHHWRLDAGRWALIAPNGRVVRLSNSEFAVMELLIGRAGRVQPRDVLRAAIRGDVQRQRVLDVLISRIRRKVWDCAHMELPLRSARKEGYVFAGLPSPTA